MHVDATLASQLESATATPIEQIDVLVHNHTHVANNCTLLLVFESELESAMATPIEQTDAPIHNRTRVANNCTWVRVFESELESATVTSYS